MWDSCWPWKTLLSPLKKNLTSFVMFSSCVGQNQVWVYGHAMASSRHATTMNQLHSVKNHEKVYVNVDDLKIKLVLGCVYFQQLSAIWSLETYLFLKMDEFLACVFGSRSWGFKERHQRVQDFFLRSGYVKLALLLSISPHLFSQCWAESFWPSSWYLWL